MLIASTWMRSMAQPIKVLFDLNIILDVLQKREPFYEHSARMLAYAEMGKIQGWVAAHSMTTLFYLVAKNQSAEMARLTLSGLLQFLSIAAVDQSVIEQAMNLAYRDFEDAVQMMCAVQNKVDYLVTRNVRDFQPALLSVIQPVDLAALI
jgi:predicted nucleic acid-binding protein